MHLLIRQTLEAFRGMWQWRWLGLTTAWLVGLIAAVSIFRMVDVYEASTRVYVDTQSVLKPLMSGLAVQPNVDEQLGVLSRTLISRPNVEKLIKMADLDLNLTSPEQKERLVDVLVRTLQIQSAGRDNLYMISYRNPSPAR